MPIYVYRCPNGHEFEVFQNMSEDPVTRCRECGAPVERVFQPIAVHFKGSGFYTTDYAKSGAKSKASEGDSGDSGSSSPDKKTDSTSKAKSSSDSASGSASGSGDKAKSASSD